MYLKTFQTGTKLAEISREIIDAEGSEKAGRRRNASQGSSLSRMHASNAMHTAGLRYYCQFTLIKRHGLHACKPMQ
jgi:hypothetical protein